MLEALARQAATLIELTRTRSEVDAREADLAASERRFRVMTGAMPQMVWTHPARRLSRFLQRPLVRIHRRAAGLDGRRRLERHVPSRRPGAGLDALAP